MAGYRRMPRDLLRALGGAKKLLVLTHENPDPDAIAAGAALSYIASKLGLGATQAYSGIIGRAENKAMVEVLNIDMVEFDPSLLTPQPIVAVVDTQPEAGNILLPPGVAPSIVVDHHPLIMPEIRAPFADIRPSYGATSTIVAEYIFGLRLPVPPSLATALFYGIKTDTQGLGRHTSDADRHVYSRLWSLVDKEALPSIEYPRLPKQYFETIRTAMVRAYVYGDIIISGVNEMDNPNAVAEVADLLLRLEGMTWSLCTGFYGGYLFLSLRTSDPDLNAGELARRVMRGLGSSGGHGVMAGGRAAVPRGAPWARRKVQQEIETRFLRAVGASGRERVKLLSPKPSESLAGLSESPGESSKKAALPAEGYLLAQ